MLAPEFYLVKVKGVFYWQDTSVSVSSYAAFVQFVAHFHAFLVTALRVAILKGEMTWQLNGLFTIDSVHKVLK